MVILIKGMNSMPKTCIDCPLHDGEYGQCNFNHMIYICFDGRPSECPLVEIDSDNLIDANKTIHAQTYNSQYEEFINKSMTIADFLDNYTYDGCPMSVVDIKEQ